MLTRRRSHALSPRDAWFLYSDEVSPDDAPTLITDIYVFDTAHRPEHVRGFNERAWLAARLNHVPALSSQLQRARRWAGGYPRWISTPEIDWSYHLRTSSAGHMTRAEFHRGLADLSTTPLDPNKPLWQLHVRTDVRGVDDIPEGATVVAFHYHHAFADAQRGAEIARTLFEEVCARPATSATTSTERSSRSAGRPSYWRLGRALVASTRAQRRLRDLVATGEVTPPARNLQPTRFNDAQNGQRELVRVKFGLNETRAVARAANVTINEILLATVGGGLVRFLETTGPLVAMVPFSTRKLSDDGSANQTTTMYVDLHAEESDPRVRVQRIHDSAAREKARVTLPESRTVEAVLDQVPSAYLKAALRRQFRLGQSGGVTAHTTLSNVAHGLNDLTFGGAPVTEMFTIPAIHRGSALGHFVTSLGDTLTLTGVADNASLPDPESYRAALVVAYQEISANY